MCDLKGLKALVIEDESIVALLIEDMLLELGCEIAASAADIDGADKLARTATVDFALLDLNLNGSSSIQIAHILTERQIPFVFSTGYGGMTRVTQGFESVPILAKPYLFDELREKLLFALSMKHPISTDDPVR